MVRNDLGRIAATGTVAVPAVFDVEKYETVWQMTSTVKARTSASLFNIFQALFPPASCTGAPKVQTTRIIAELETSPRRIYTGSIGFLAPGRKAQFNVAIRTLLVDKLNSEAEYGVGGGIVWDSVEEAEYDECAVKAKIVCTPAVDFELLETLLWTPEENYFLLDFHLERLKASALYFSFPFKGNEIRVKLASLASGLPAQSHRVRLLLNRKGEIVLEPSPCRPVPADKPRVCLAKHPVASDNVFLYHKTTNRMVYDQARALCPGYDEVVLWNEKGQVTEFCTANIIVDLDGQMLTPPVSCGLLPGTCRAWLLKKGEITEQVIEKEMLARSRKIFLCNSVRKMQEIKFSAGDGSAKSVEIGN
jgi:para-aminobenzoate synthetase/4-amino-4-deoxychorismate lyase